MVRRVYTLVVLFFVLIGGVGCFSSHSKNIAEFMKPYQVDVTSPDYILQPPDEIEVLCAKIPELNLQRQQIRPDGRVSFEALGEIKVTGKTPAQVADELKQKAAQLYTLSGDKPIDVRITAYRSKVYYVLGEVDIPGPKIHTGRVTLLTAITEANPAVTGWTQRIQVIRPSVEENSDPKIFEVNFDKMIVKGDLRKNVLLQEGDIVYVPPTPLSSVAMVVEEFVRPIGRALAPALTVSRISD
ncbi:MAG: polysaccharide biosynthesis/export family protein [Sedimentisphaerales bacterium]|nr:polysaccharide biosynthesis/export family protein [Sedimentisphaerales bacterium]